MATKYIRMAEGFVLFPDEMVHAEVAGALDCQPSSAGQVQFSSKGAVCTGRSASLGLTANPSDSKDLNRQLGILPPSKLKDVEAAVVLALMRVIDKHGRDAVGVVLREIAENLLVRPE